MGLVLVLVLGRGCDQGFKGTVRKGLNPGVPTVPAQGSRTVPLQQQVSVSPGSVAWLSPFSLWASVPSSVN
jgi:hypothetical protein